MRCARRNTDESLQTVPPQQAIQVDAIDAGSARGGGDVAALAREQVADVGVLEYTNRALAGALERLDGARRRSFSVARRRFVATAREVEPGVGARWQRRVHRDARLDLVAEL